METETKRKRREWVKTAAIIFLAVLLVLTFFSSTILNASLPEVATRAVESGSINAAIRITGTATANEDYEVVLKQTRTVGSVLVREGDEVAAGDVLFVLEADDSEEVKAAEEALAQLRSAYQRQLIAASNAAAQENRTIEKAREAYNEALEQYNAYTDQDPARLNSLISAATAALKEAQDKATEANEAYQDLMTSKEYATAQNNVTDAESDLAALNSQAESLQSQIDELNRTGTVDTTAIDRQIAAQEQAIQDAETALARDQIIYQADYDTLKNAIEADMEAKLLAEARAEVEQEAADAGETPTEEELSARAAARAAEKKAALGDEWARQLEITMAACAKSPALISAYIPGVTEEEAAALSEAYEVLTGDQRAIDAAKAELEQLKEDRRALLSADGSASAIRTLRNRLSAVESSIKTATSTLNAAKAVLAMYEGDIADLKKQAGEAQNEADAAQKALDDLNSASAAAAQVNSAREALEDLLFQQSLQDTTAMDLQEARDAVARQENEVNRLRTEYDASEVTARVAGTISSISAQAGKSIAAGTPLATINVTSRGYTLEASIPISQAQRLRVGDTAEVTSYYWGSEIEAVLENIRNDTNNRQNRMVTFRLTGDVDPGVNLTLTVGQRTAGFDAIIPKSALRSDANGTFVLMISARSTPLGNRYTATRVAVEQLAEDDTNVAVTGLSAGDFVITTSTSPIEPGMQVRLADNQS